MFSKPFKRKATTREDRLNELARVLQNVFLEKCHHDPGSLLVNLTRENFQNCYMAWKFACGFQPQMHQTLDAELSELDDVEDAIRAVYHFALVHHLPHVSTKLEGGEKSNKSKKSKTYLRKQKLVERARALLKNAKKPGEPGFNEYLTNFYAKKVQEIRSAKFKCAKEGKFWSLEPYQRSAMFLGGPRCQFVPRLLVVHPTGSGKTAVMYNIISQYLHDDRVKLFLAPSVQIQQNFYSQISKFDTLLAKYVARYPHVTPHELLTFSPRGPAPFHIQNYKKYLTEALKVKGPERRALSRKMFGKEEWQPWAPIRSIDLTRLTTLFEASNPHEVLAALKANNPCVTERHGATGRSDLVTLRADYGYDSNARKVHHGKVFNPFDNRVIVIDEVDRLFESLGHIKRRMLIYLLQYAKKSVIIGLTATPLVQGDSTYSSQTSKVLEMIKGPKGADPLAPTATPITTNEGYVSFFYSFRPPLYPRTIPDLNSTHEVVLGRILFSVLNSQSLKHYRSKLGGADQYKLHQHQKYYRFMGYATSKYLDQWARQSNMMQNVLKDFEKHSAKLVCLANTMADQPKKSVILFTEGMEAFRVFLKHKRPELFRYTEFMSPKNEEESTRVLRKFNAPSNLEGQEIRYMCATRNYMVGINFHNVRRIVMVSPPIDESMYLQTVGRVLRMCTYAKLPEEDRNVQVDIMVATADKHRTLNQLKDLAPSQDMVTVDEVALHHLLKEVGKYRQRIKAIFKDSAIDRTWIVEPSTGHHVGGEELEKRCYDPHDVEEEETTSSKSHRGKLGRGSDKDLHKQSRGIGVSVLSRHPADFKNVPKQLPVLSDAQEMKLAEAKFRDLSIPSIREHEFKKLQGAFQVPNIPVQVFVFESSKDIPQIMSTMQQYTNALVLVKDHYPETQDFGRSDRFRVEVMVAEAAKKWMALAKYYNEYFVGGDMPKWNKVVGFNLFYLKWKKRVYIQYEPNIRMIRPVLFTNLKAWIHSLGNKSLTQTDFQRIYETMPEFRNARDRVRYKGGKPQTRPDGTIDVTVEIRVPDLASHRGETKASIALSQPQAYQQIHDVYANILSNMFGIDESQMRSKLVDGKYLVFVLSRVQDDMDLAFEEALNQKLLDPDPDQRSRIPIKTMDGRTEEAVLKTRFGVNRSNITQFIRYARGTALPDRIRDMETKEDQNYWKHVRDGNDGNDRFPSSKEVLNQNHGYVWILVGSDGKFRMYPTKGLPREATVNPYRDQVQFQEAKESGEAYVLLDKITPWQMVVTKPYASIRQFALHSTESEWGDFWRACWKVREEYQMETNKTLYMYTDEHPTIAQFHVNFSLHAPRARSTAQPDKAQSHHRSDRHQAKKVRFEDKKPLDSSNWTLVENCAKVGDEVYLVVFNLSGVLHGTQMAEYTKIMVVNNDLPHTKWRPDRTAEMSIAQAIRLRYVTNTSDLGLHSLEDLAKFHDFRNEEGRCVRVIVKYSFRPWVLENAKWVSPSAFGELKGSSVLEAVKSQLVDYFAEYFSELEKM